MDNLYLQSIYEHLLSQKETNNYNFNVLLLRREDIASKFSRGDYSLLPCICLFGGYEYTTITSEKSCIDFSRELPGNIAPSIHILTDTISSVIEMENFITSLFSTPLALEAIHPYRNNDHISFNIAINDLTKITREHSETLKDITLYETIIPLFSENTLIFMRNYHPAEIEYDKMIQFNLVERGKVIEELRTSNNSFTAEQLQQLDKGYNELISSLNLSELNGFGFAELYQTMKDEKCDIKKAINMCVNAVEEKERQIFEEQKHAEEQRIKEENKIKKINKTYGSLNKKGDVVINQYTEAIIEDMKNRMSFEYPVPIYGASTFYEWHHKYELNEVEYPSILIRDSIRFTSEYKDYEILSKDGSIIKQRYSAEILPITFQINIMVHSKDKKQCEEITNRIKQWYSEPQKLNIDLPVLYEAILPITIHYNQPVSEFKGRDFSEEDDMYVGSLWFHEMPCIYYDDESNKIDATTNRQLQFNLMEKAIFCNECAEKLRKILSHYGLLYENLTDGKKLLLGLFYDKPFKELKNCYDNKLPLNKEVFDKNFPEIIECFPDLYEKTSHGYSYRELNADLKKYIELFNKQRTDICSLLGIQFEKDVYNSPTFKTPAHSSDNLRDYIEMMEDDLELTLKDAIAIVETEITESRMNVQSDTSSSDGLFATLARQTYESHNIKKHAGDIGKRDLLGQAGCAKNQGGTCAQCSIKHGCSRYFI